ncbi:MAG: DUF4388 domain-containing protein, partial [Holophagales bacterium]|nr:DUF4388 domain-containing protein [Holophagales bacterium]
MPLRLALVFHPDPVAREQIAGCLEDAGLETLRAEEAEAARGALLAGRATLVFLPASPDDRTHADLLGLVDPRTALVGLMARTGEQPEDPSRFADTIGPPFDHRRLLEATRTALELQESEPDEPPSSLSGSLRDFGSSALLQSLEQNRQTAIVELEGPRGRGRIWMLQGKVVEAATPEGVTGREAVAALLLWEEGEFRVRMESHGIEGPLEDAPTALLLELHHAQDESRRQAEPLHRSLILINGVCSYASEALASELVVERLRACRVATLGDWPELQMFTVSDQGLVGTVGHPSGDPEHLLPAVESWGR